MQKMLQNEQISALFNAFQCIVMVRGAPHIPHESQSKATCCPHAVQPNAAAVARRVQRRAHNKGRANDKFIAFLVIIKASIAQRWYQRVLDADVFEVAVGWYETREKRGGGR
jgi:hypothetical protein